MKSRITPSGLESRFQDEELIVTKTDITGRLTYCNTVFIRMSGFSETELVGQPHSIIRHPDMPRAVFKMMWETIVRGEEIFAYVVNLAKNGDHYWVLAHITPSFDAAGKISGYHSNRRVPQRTAVDRTIQIYRDLRRIEGSGGDRKASLQESVSSIGALISKSGGSFNEFVLAL